MTAVILPGATIGVFGSGQLGRMFALSARSMGYRVHTFSPDHDSPTGHIADLEITASYDDLDAVGSFAQNVDVITFEFENVSSSVSGACQHLGVPVRPGGWVLNVAQERIREKEFLASAGFPVADHSPIGSLQELEAAAARIGLPAVLKTAAFGYDGKGQFLIRTPSDIEPAWDGIGHRQAVLEAFVEYHSEISVVGARGAGGAFAHFGAIENIHRNHILDISIAPARIPAPTAARAVELAASVMEKLDVIGVLCVEFFVTSEQNLLINEIAPRPHNSGHLTLDAAVTSQFEQQVRAVCGLPLGATELLRPAVMVNLLGDLWSDGEPNWRGALADPAIKLHLYGKREARPGRKMGHLTIMADDVDTALRRAQAARQALSTPLLPP